MHSRKCGGDAILCQITLTTCYFILTGLMVEVEQCVWCIMYVCVSDSLCFFCENNFHRMTCRLTYGRYFVLVFLSDKFVRSSFKK